MVDLPKRVALVYDWVYKWGGAEQILLNLHEIFPQAPLYTAIYDSDKAKWASVFPKVIPSFLQKLPLAKSHHELYPWLTPLAFETFNFNQYDTVISLTSADAKSIITSPSTFHLCICLTPNRFLWSHREVYQNSLPRILKPAANMAFRNFRNYDLISSQRPDAYIAISNTVRTRISKYYHRDSEVIYPPVDISKFTTHNLSAGSQDYFLYVGRLVSYKRVDILVKAFNYLNIPLTIAGIGNQESYLRSIAKPNIRFTGFVSDTDLIDLYHNCKAVIFFHEEDFGIVPVEAQVAGKPVIALNSGGASETVVHNRTGILINSDTTEALINAVSSFNPQHFSASVIRKNAEKYSKEKFRQKFVKVLASEWTKYKNTYTS